MAEGHRSRVKIWNESQETEPSSMHPLDHPIWTALTTRHRSLAEGGALARRYPPVIAPFAAMADASPESYAALAALMAPGDQAVLFTSDPLAPPESFAIMAARSMDQMMGMPVEAAPAADIVVLGSADVPAMMELTELTRPGPFSLRTHELGIFLGIRIDGRLVAMTGARMRPGRYTEMTAVCVHPDYRGRGYAQLLLAAVSRKLVAQGEIPFLHVFSDNDSAVALYRRQGMELRRRLHATVLSRSAGLGSGRGQYGSL